VKFGRRYLRCEKAGRDLRGRSDGNLSLGVVPQVDTKLLSPETFVRDATSPLPGAWSRLAEAYRSLRTTILLSRAGTPPQVILISSAKPSEGKTSITTLESIVFALNGARVLLIDSDLRRPSVHLRFRIANKVGPFRCVQRLQICIVKCEQRSKRDVAVNAGSARDLPAPKAASMPKRQFVNNFSDEIVPDVES